MLAVCASALAAQATDVRLEQTTVIGVEHGDSDLEFGDIGGVGVDPDRGTIFVFDRLRLRLTAFGPSGDLMDAVGRNGSGPREFLSGSWPVVHGSTVYLSDFMNGRISVWELRDDSLVHVDVHRLDVISEQICGTDTHLYLLRYANGGTVQRVDPSTWAVAPFGRPLVELAGLNPEFLSGLIGCDREEGSVYVSSIISGVRKYDGRTGTLLWEQPIPGVVPPRVEVDVSTGLPRYRREEGQPWMTQVSLVPVGRGRLWLQLAETPRTAAAMRPGYSGTDIVDVHTFVFDASTGEMIERRTDLPRVDYAAGGQVYSRAADPFPLVRVYDWR